MTNITEFLGRDLTDVLPAVCGAEPGGADYERFRAFCRCAERFPDSADVRQVREILQICFSCDTEPDAANCDAIWRMTSEALLAGRVRAMPAQRLCPLPCPELPQFSGTVVDCPALEDAGSWSAWETNAKKALAGAEAVRVRLPVGFRAGKVSLWQAERILTGESTDPCGAVAQQIDFLAGFCSAGRRMVLETACEAGEVLQQLSRTADRRMGLPPLVWNFAPGKGPDRAMLLAVLQLVRVQEGVPPVLTTQTA